MSRTADHDAVPDAYTACHPGTAPPPGMDGAEWALRIELAGLYRVVHRLGWCDLIFNHITARVPGPQRRFLINPFGLRYDEVTASNLVLVDLEGRPVAPTRWPVNAAGFVVHGAVHRARDDAHVVMHTHPRAGMAVACKAEGLSHDSFYGAMLSGEVAYHPFEGITVHEGEMDRLAASLGGRSLMILRNHGLLACGADVPTCFFAMWLLQRACETQCDAQALAGPHALLPEAVRERTRQDRHRSRIDPQLARTVLAALRRELDATLTPATDYRC
jgi:ribulose-5-phosphate 4-epimerase/fuculose-1-phosphate aldolase